ncbi:MAG: DUF4412 domain-containing protein [Acidobacteriota bacterium]|nr:DUF4412 domain-containing protein [Acidobacteriota bacterium]
MNDERGIKCGKQDKSSSVHSSSFRVHRFLNTFPKILLTFSLTLSLAVASCKRSEVTENQNIGAANSNGATEETYSSPPFATKEPERYQALRVITSSSGAGESVNSQTFIARDGVRRREDYETAGVKVSLLELPAGTYVLLPEKRMYAELKPEAGDGGGAGTQPPPPDFSPDKLLNEVRPEAHYERLGPETLNGRATTKYRVTLKGMTGAARETAAESLVWVDENLGMPVKTEMSSAGGPQGGAHVIMELRDIKETVDANLFDIPQDYRKTDLREIVSQLNSSSAAGR